MNRYARGSLLLVSLWVSACEGKSYVGRAKPDGATPAGMDAALDLGDSDVLAADAPLTGQHAYVAPGASCLRYPTAGHRVFPYDPTIAAGQRWPTCTLACNAVQAMAGAAIAPLDQALPAGPCDDEGATCDSPLMAGWCGPCAETGGPGNGYTCICRSQRWHCALTSQGMSTCDTPRCLGLPASCTSLTWTASQVCGCGQCQSLCTQDAECASGRCRPNQVCPTAATCPGPDECEVPCYGFCESDADAGDAADGKEAAPEIAPEVSTAPEVADAELCPYPGTARAVDGGQPLYSWHVDWRQGDLDSVCASYGAGAKMVVEIRPSGLQTSSVLPPCTAYEVMLGADHACALPNVLRVEADCLAGELLFEDTASDSGMGTMVGYGYYHIESPTVPAPPRKLLIVDPACRRALHPRFVPMAAAGSPETGTDTASKYFDPYDPSANGQPCRTDGDCRPEDQRCFIDASVASCAAGPVGRCVGHVTSNCAAYAGCPCLRIAGVVCGSADPGTACGALATPANPDLGPATQGCYACIPPPDGSILYPPAGG